MAAYTRCLRCAGAPRRPASGSELSLLIPSWHAVLSDHGESDIDIFQNFDADIGLRRMTTGSALPILPQSVPRGQSISWLHWFASATACQVACPPTDLTGILPQPPGTFTSRLSTDWSPSPLLDITTTATGPFCWRDSHPLEWQLASLHGHWRLRWSRPRLVHARLTHAAFKHVAHAEVATDLFHVDRLALVGKGRVACDYVQFRQLLSNRTQLRPPVSRARTTPLR